MQDPDQKTLDDLASLLRRRIAIIANHSLRDSDPDAQMNQLRSVSAEISSVHTKNKSSFPPRLNHFLEQASFAKALDFIEGLKA